MNTSEFRYLLPTEAIAQTPASPRDAARLLVAGTLENRRFRDLPELLAPGDLVVVNHTRVRHARLQGRKASGGRIEVLLLRRVDPGHWEALVRPARRVGPGTTLDFGGIAGEVVDGPEDGKALLALRAESGDVETVLTSVGEVPLPPYITTPLDDPGRYQTIFAKRPGSAAAPTAGLHFTPAVVEGLAERGVEIAEIDLEVGLDTFRPIAVECIADHVIHTERFDVPSATARAVAAARDRRGRVVAIGTTVARALESAASGRGRVRPGSGRTGLYITPGFRWQVVDVLVTNFHAPATSLVVMVAAFMGPAWREVYAYALEHGYRFLSFGDAMLAVRAAGTG